MIRLHSEVWELQESSRLDISTGELIRISVVLFYVPIVFISYWRLIPRLSPSAKRLAVGMLAAQVIVIVASLGIQATSDFDKWLWDFHEEWNIPATLASVQLAVVGGVGLVAAWLARGRPALLRVYLVAVGLVFLFLALDEFLALHEFVPDWETRYIALGATVVVATILVALRSPRRAWVWHFCLLTGLAISVAGALVLNALPIRCGSMGFLRFDGCLEFFFLEESFELLGIWLALVALLGHFSDAVPMPEPRIRRLLYVCPGSGFSYLFSTLLSLALKFPSWLTRQAQSSNQECTCMVTILRDEVVITLSGYMHLLANGNILG